MVRNYKRKIGSRGHETFTDPASNEKMDGAIKLVNEGLSIKRAAELTGVKRTTLSDKVNK